MPDTILTHLLAAADNHGEDSGEPDHTIGDLQDLLRKAWALLNHGQRVALLESDEVESVLDCGGRDEIEPSDLIERQKQDLQAKIKALRDAGIEVTATAIDSITHYRGQGKGVRTAYYQHHCTAVEAAFEQLQERDKRVAQAAHASEIETPAAPVNPVFAWRGLPEYEKHVGKPVSEPFRMGWYTARTTKTQNDEMGFIWPKVEDYEAHLCYPTNDEFRAGWDAARNIKEAPCTDEASLA